MRSVVLEKSTGEPGTLRKAYARFGEGRTEKYPPRQLAGRLLHFVVLHPDLATIEQTKRLTEEWLAGMGLQLKPSKTRISHTLNEHGGNVGFDFLGFEVRQHRTGKTHSAKSTHGEPLGFKTIIRPSKETQRRHLAAIKEIIHTHKAAPQAALITALNPVIRGWANYYRAFSSTEVFSAMGHCVYLKLWRWAKRRHPHKSRRWVASKYWNADQGRRWNFVSSKHRVWLQRHSDIHVQRHIKVKGRRSPYDGDWVYWATRMGRHPELSNRIAKLLKRQKGHCIWCGLYFKDGDLLEVDHKIPTAKGGEDLPSNWQLLHGSCHDEKTALDFRSAAGDAHDKGRTVEEPDDGKLSCPVLETSRRG